MGTGRHSFHSPIFLPVCYLRDLRREKSSRDETTDITRDLHHILHELEILQTEHG